MPGFFLELFPESSDLLVVSLVPLSLALFMVLSRCPITFPSPFCRPCSAISSTMVQECLGGVDSPQEPIRGLSDLCLYTVSSRVCLRTC